MNSGCQREEEPGPNSGLDEQFAAAELAWREGRIDEAEEIYRRILVLEPDNPRVLLWLGVMLAQNGHIESATAALRKLLSTEPDNIEGLNWLAAILRETQQFAEAAEYAQRAVALRPDPDGLTNLGQCYFSSGQFLEAGECFREVAESRPTAAAFWNWGLALQRQERDNDTEWTCRQGLAQFPDDPQLNGLLGQLLLGEEDPKPAVAHLRIAYNADPNSIPRMLQLAQALEDDRQYDETEILAKRVLELSPREPMAITILGSVKQFRGKFEEANALFDQAIEIEPDLIAPYFDRAFGNKLTEADRPFIERLKSLLIQDKQEKEPIRYLEYATGKALNDIGEYGEAIAHFDEANRLSVERMHARGDFFKKARFKAGFDHKVKLFTKNFIVRNSGQISTSKMPIFVVGMMRSGTTLTEQILSSHPEIGGAGEVPFWTLNSKDAMEAGDTAVSRTAARDLAETYLRQLRAAAPRSAYVVDKMPHNYLFVGLLTIIFPNAKIFHCRRNPADNCLSIYMTPFRDSPNYGHDRDNIAYAYREYRRLMDHWHEVIPPGRMIDVDYEELVADRETMTRKMIDFCGLPWSDSCLRHEDNQRVVSTASKWQARQPIYKTSVERWRRYEPWLGPFKDLLDEYCPVQQAA